MFVRQYKYDNLKKELSVSQRQREINAREYWKLKQEHDQLDAKYKKLLDKHNKLVREINGKGGQEFLDGAVFTKTELTSILQLVHPDKHGGKESAHRLTQKINSLRR